METLFFFSALIGGTFLLCQFAMTILGMSDGGEHSDLEIADGEISDGEFHADGELHGESSHHSSWLFGVISFRTLVAASTFFGLTGMFMTRIGANRLDQLMMSICSGTAALFGVHWLMKSFQKLNQNGTLRTENTLGKQGTVNVTIPSLQTGRGKVLLPVQGRLEEFAAVTSQSTPIPTGSKVQIIGVLYGNVLEVETLPVTAGSHSAKNETATIPAS